MKTVFDQTAVGGAVLRNRFIRSATWMGMAGLDGLVTGEIVALYRGYAESLVGGIVTGFTSVSPWDGELPGAMRLASDAHVAGHRRITDAVHAEGGRIFLQAAMLDTFVPGETGHGVLKDVDSLTQADMRSIVDVYRRAAERAEAAGYDGIQIHAAHFFCLSKIISPCFNHRRDRYGGDSRGRARILAEILEAVRGAARAGFAVAIKINCADFAPGGLETGGFLETCAVLDSAGIDAIEVSGNGTSRQHVRPGAGEAYFLEAALALRERVRYPVALVGGVRSLETANAICANGIDLVALSRPLICEPDLVARWHAGDTRPSRCVSCNSCYSTPRHQCIMRLKGGARAEASR